MKIRNSIFILSVSLLAVVFVACKKKNQDKKEEEETTFDKTAMLSNYADNVIIPNFQSFKVSLDSFVISFNAFIQTKSPATLATLRQKYIAANVKFQHVSTFEFGPSESEIVRSNFNTYPTNTVQVNSNINSGSYNLGTISNLDAKGFPALDYLIFGKNETDASLITLFDTDPKAASRITYVNDCLTEMQNKTNAIVNAWNNSYRSSFTSSTGSQIGSSLGLMVNQLNFEIDLLKNGKIGIPLGKKSLGVVLPEKCESFYANNISVNLAKECLLNIEDVYLGRSAAGTDGKGLDDLLEDLNAQHGTESLNTAIKNQFTLAKSKLNLVAEPLSASVNNATSTVDAAYLEMVKLLVLLKTDTPSALGIVITYQDGDGD
ncbi:MAG: imelysin family protein [Bacteroidetes bacterium]|nr:imelysin family protein [Bacteroidota bacterium]